MSRKKVLLVGWDAADWKVIHPLMDAGLMPNVQRLVENGAMAQIATLHPPLSPMLWTSIATGERPFKHGIHGFSEPTADGSSIQPVTNLSRKCKAVWNILNQNSLKSIVIGWWPSHPAEPINGVMVSDHFHKAHGPLEKGWPLLPGAVHPADLADTLAELRFHPDELEGAMVEFFVPRAREIDQDKDRRLASLASIICECTSIHSAATWLIENREWDLFAVYYDAIDHFSHGFMRYNPPRQERIPEADYELYKGVVQAGYRYHDMMLGTLLKKISPDVNVILMSDHGFHPDHLRPKAIPPIPAGPAIEHRDFGILVLSGPRFKKDELLHGAGVLDVAPTLLTVFDLPIGADMDGKVLAGAFAEPPEIQTIASWEDVPGKDGRHPPDTRLDPVATRESLEQLIALGYIERPDENHEKAVADTVDELRYNLGEAYQDAGRHAEALDIFRELYKKDPDEQRYAVHLFVSCQALGYVSEMRRIVEDLDGPRRAKFEEAQAKLKELREIAKERLGRASRPAQPEATQREAGQEARPTEPILTEEERKEFARCQRLARFQPPAVDYLKAQVLTAEKKYFDALECLGRVQEAHLARPGLFIQTADLYRRLGRWNEAEETYRKALSVDPDNPHAHLGMCRVALRRRDFDAAVDAALEGLQRLYEYPVGHFLLGVALAGLQDYARAADAFRAALALNPNFPQAHLRLGLVLKRRLNDPEAAEEHFKLWRELRRAARKGRTGIPPVQPSSEPASAAEEQAPASPPAQPQLPPLNGELVVVSGLPRSGTSMLMQMLAAAKVPILTDGERRADEDNPRGYFEFEPVKKMHKDAAWVADAKGKAVKIVAPLLGALPQDVPCRIIFVERNLDEILASQGEMMVRRGAQVEDTLDRRARLKEEYARLVRRMKTYLARRPETHTLYLRHDAVLRDPAEAARAVNSFLGGGLPVEAMAAEVDPRLRRQRSY